MAPVALAEPGGGIPEGSMPADKKLPRENQVQVVCKLLTLKGESVAGEIRRRIKDRKGIVAKGLYFDTEVLIDALKLWERCSTLQASEPGHGTQRDPQEVPTKEQSVRPTAVEAPAMCRKRQAQAELLRAAKEPKLSNVNSPAKRTGLRDRMASRTTGAVDVATPCRNPSPLPPRPPLSSPRAKPAETVSRDGGLKRLRRQSEPAATTKFASACSTPSSCMKGSKIKSESPARCSYEPSFMSSTACEPCPEPSPKMSSVKSQGARPPNSDPELLQTSSPVGGSVKDLKAMLSRYKLDFSGCVEKAELHALWSRFDTLRSNPLDKLHAEYIATGGPQGTYATPDECARHILTRQSVPQKTRSPDTPPASSRAVPAAKAAALPTASPAPTAPVVSSVRNTDELDHRLSEAMRESKRIFSLRKESFPSIASWGFAVLDTATRDIESVQRGYRILMKKLHPDKIGSSTEGTKAVELMREAKNFCERSLSRRQAPGIPRDVHVEALCLTPGRRKFRLRWTAPREQALAPVQRYVVAALDPAYGKPLTVTILEPDYSEALKRFVSVEELAEYILAEEELQKMPSLWQQPFATMHVAAANDAGQSQWATVKVPLSTAAACSARSVNEEPRSDPIDDDRFEVELQQRHGNALRSWLEKQKKAPIASWLRSVRWPAGGTKDELVDRVIRIMEGEGSIGGRGRC